MAEHEEINAVLNTLFRAVRVEREGKLLGNDFWHDAIDFVRTFSDNYHHAKEENILFPALEACGMSPDSGPVGVMLGEHEQGRALVRSMGGLVGQARDGDRDAEPALRTAASGFVELITSHIAKEDGILFDMADQLIQGPACDILCAAYAELADERYEGHWKQDLVDMAGEILEVG